MDEPHVPCLVTDVRFFCCCYQRLDGEVVYLSQFRMALAGNNRYNEGWLYDIIKQVITMRPRLKWLSAAASLGMFLVLIAGALVTKTESGRGCGDDWPLCNGKFIPAYTFESMIEYSHRAVTGIVGILVLATLYSMYKAFGRRSEPFFYASGAFIFTVVQAILGAMAVVREQSSAVMALHFGFSLIAFMFTLLLVIRVWRQRREYDPDYENQQITLQNNTKIQPFFRKLVWMVTIYTYVVVYIGAFVRHTESSGGCTGWPLCNGAVIPELAGTAAIAFGHRLAALLLLLFIIWIAVLGLRDYGHSKEIRRMSILVLLLMILQVLSGAWIALTLGSESVYVFASLIHTTIIASMFALLCYMSVRVWQLQA